MAVVLEKRVCCILGLLPSTTRLPPTVTLSHTDRRTMSLRASIWFLTVGSNKLRCPPSFRLEAAAGALPQSRYTFPPFVIQPIRDDPSPRAGLCSRSLFHALHDSRKTCLPRFGAVLVARGICPACAYSSACSRTPMRARAVLNCGALRGAAKSYVLDVRIASSRVSGSRNGCMRC